MWSRISLSILTSLALSLVPLTRGLLMPRQRTCTNEKMEVRKEWSSLALSERRAFTDAVQCLLDSPSKLNTTEYPAVVSRYDDFVAVHINYTFSIHLDAIFLPWHRGYVRLFEQALQKECGYNSALPYWDWPLYTDAPLRNSTLFDGSPYSMGSDGVFTNATLDFPKGTGGGCVYEGPFSNRTTTFVTFPGELITDNIKNNGSGALPANAFQYNASCFQRNLNDWALRTNNNAYNISVLLNQTTIKDFQNTLSSPEGSTWFGAHGGGHVAMGGVGADLFTSPTDPVFFLHHAQVDHVWWQWQQQDLEARAYALDGTKTLENVPPSNNLTLEDYLTWGPLMEDKQVVNLMLPHEGIFCYRYE